LAVRLDAVCRAPAPSMFAWVGVARSGRPRAGCRWGDALGVRGSGRRTRVVGRRPRVAWFVGVRSRFVSGAGRLADRRVRRRL